MQNAAKILLDDCMAVYVENEFTRAKIDYTTEKVVLENGELINCLTFDGCDPYIGNYIFHAGATFHRETLLQLSLKNKL